jgi:hypothetical protein
MADVTVETADGLQLRGIEQCLADANQRLVRVHFDPRGADLTAVAQRSQMKFDEDRLLGKVVHRALNV